MPSISSSSRLTIQSTHRVWDETSAARCICHQTAKSFVKHLIQKVMSKHETSSDVSVVVGHGASNSSVSEASSRDETSIVADDLDRNIIGSFLYGFQVIAGSIWQVAADKTELLLWELFNNLLLKVGKHCIVEGNNNNVQFLGSQLPDECSTDTRGSTSYQGPSIKKTCHYKYAYTIQLFFKQYVPLRIVLCLEILLLANVRAVED